LPSLLGSVDPAYAGVASIEQIPDFTRKQIEHFFRHYKESEPDKYVRVDEWRGEAYAKRLISVGVIEFS
jgi:inorganic pyrophosphatase